MTNIEKRAFCVFLVFCFCVASIFSFVLVKAYSYKEKFNLFGKVIYVDAGHGGKDNGASFDGVLEDEINLKIAGFVVEELIDVGAIVYTSRTSDYDLSNIYDKNKKRNDLINRVRMINNSKVDIFISIHLNSYSSTKVRGAQVFYQNNDLSKLLSKYIQSNLNVLTNSGKKDKYGDYYILNKSQRVGVLIECGFLSNSEERSRLIDESYQQKLAYKIREGVVEYFDKSVD